MSEAFEWKVGYETHKSHEFQMEASPKPPGVGWLLDSIEFKTDTIYVIPKEGWGKPEVVTHVTICSFWKRKVAAAVP